MSIRVIRDPEDLQARINLRRATLSIAEANRKPFAVRIDGGDLVYGEYYELTEDDALTFFSGNRIPILRREWYVDVEKRLDLSDELVDVRMGEVEAQPYEGKARVVAINQSSSGWFTTLWGIGEMARHEVPD